MRALFPVLLLGCSDYKFIAQGDGTEGEDSSTIDSNPPDSAPPVVEDCEAAEASADSVTIDETCLAPDIEISDPWNVNIEWQYTVSSGSGVIVMPAVGNLTDDNNDGVINEQDSPDIVFTTWSSNTLVALHGDGSGVIFERSGFSGDAGVAIADVDNDGTPDIIAATTSGQVAAVSGLGTTLWTSAPFGWQSYPQPVVADLEGDGDVEIVFDIAVVEGTNGATVATLGSLSTSWRAPVVADLDADGIQEILLGENTYAPDGTVKWSVSGSGDSVFSAVADIDGDAGGESFWVTGNLLHIVDDDGTLIRTVSLNTSSSRPGPPSVADFDGDGQVEIAVPASSQLEMFEIDGTPMWSATITDSSGIAGCSGYDVNADGAYEVLYADEQRLRIYDGATGSVLYENTSHTSATLWEYPVVADVDGDGSAEIVIASNGSIWKGVTVLGHNGDGWAPSGPTWPVHDFAMTNVNADGSVPSPAPRSWEVYNVFRARPTVDDAATDLRVSVVDSCFSGCEAGDHVEVTVQAENLGGLDSAAGLWVSLFQVGGGSPVLIESQQLSSTIAAGRSTDSILFTLTADQVGSGNLLVIIDDDGTGVGVQNECDESNNRELYTDIPC
ncbi:MAG: hypothetical protein ACI8RZ_002224 [Myxococcota bacterium]|jgi:hypothetical protein